VNNLELFFYLLFMENNNLQVQCALDQQTFDCHVREVIDCLIESVSHADEATHRLRLTNALQFMMTLYADGAASVAVSVEA
jgi:hypothetical protein